MLSLLSLLLTSLRPFTAMWFRPTLVISLAVAVHAIEVLLDDECEGNECSLEMLHLRAKKMAVEKGARDFHGRNDGKPDE